MEDLAKDKIQVLLRHITTTVNANDALKYTQATVNIANCLLSLKGVEQNE